MRARFGLVEADTGDVVTERLDAGLAEYVADAGERDWLRPAARRAARARTAALRSPGRTCSPPGRRSSSTSPSDDRTVVLVIDDAQHADDGLLDFLDHLLATGTRADLRPGPRPARAAGPPRRRSAAAGPASCASTRSTTTAMADARRRAGRRAARRDPVRAGRTRRGHPAVRRRDGARPDRPRPRRAPGRPVRRRPTAPSWTSTRSAPRRRCRPWSRPASTR